jgi:nitroreductase
MRTTTTLPDHRLVLGALRLANRAPSAHNAQPWHWLVGGYSVHLMAERNRDPGERDLVVSCGAALHHLRTALAASGWHAEADLLPGADPDHLAAVEVLPRDPSEQDIALARAIPRRHTDRGPFASFPVPDGHVDLLAGRAADEGAVLVPVTDPAHRRVVTTAIAAAAGWQDDTRPDTVPDCAEELLVLATADDDVVSRLRAGAAASAVLLAATGLGLATCPLSRLLAIGHTREDLRDGVLGGAAHPQLVLRIGWPATEALTREPLTRSERRTLAETVTYLPGACPRRDEH